MIASEVGSVSRAVDVDRIGSLRQLTFWIELSLLCTEAHKMWGSNGSPDLLGVPEETIIGSFS